MPYVLSKLANAQTYVKYAKGGNNINIPMASVTIKGGADVADKKTLTSPQGVITSVTADELEILKENPCFQQHLEQGFVNYYNMKPDVEKKAEKMPKDKSRQLTKEDFKKQGKKAPKTAEE